MGILSFNSDIVECKVDYEKLQSLVDNCFNSDIVECKEIFSKTKRPWRRVLIAT